MTWCTRSSTLYTRHMQPSGSTLWNKPQYDSNYVPTVLPCESLLCESNLCFTSPSRHSQKLPDHTVVILICIYKWSCLEFLWCTRFTFVDIYLYKGNFHSNWLIGVIVSVSHHNTTMSANGTCQICSNAGKYRQGGKTVCERCFSNMDDMVCVRCKGTRKSNAIFLMSCPCYDDDDVQVSDDWSSDGDLMAPVSTDDETSDWTSLSVEYSIINLLWN